MCDTTFRRQFSEHGLTDLNDSSEHSIPIDEETCWLVIGECGVKIAKIGNSLFERTERPILMIQKIFHL